MTIIYLRWVDRIIDQCKWINTTHQVQRFPLYFGSVHWNLTTFPPSCLLPFSPASRWRTVLWATDRHHKTFCSQTRNSAFLRVTVYYLIIIFFLLQLHLPGGSSVSEIIGNSECGFMSAPTAGSRYSGGVGDGDLWPGDIGENLLLAERRCDKSQQLLQLIS